MSKSVRLPDYLAAEVERLAQEEKRSLANMVRVLLEQALRMDQEPVTKETIHLLGDNAYAVTQVSTTPRAERERASGDTDVEPDFK